MKQRMISSNKQSYMYAAFVCEVSFSSVHNATKWFYIQHFLQQTAMPWEGHIDYLH